MVAKTVKTAITNSLTFLLAPRLLKPAFGGAGCSSRSGFLSEPDLGGDVLVLLVVLCRRLVGVELLVMRECAMIDSLILDRRDRDTGVCW